MASAPIIHEHAYSEIAKAQVIEHVLVEVATGRNVARVLREDDGMPSAATFWRWHLQDEKLQDDLVRARELGVEAILDEVIEIVDDASDDAYIDYQGKGEDRTPVAKIDGRAIRRATLQAEYRVKMAQMMKPKKYGNKVDVTSDGQQLKPAQLNSTKLEAIIGVVAQRKAERLKDARTEDEDDA